MIAEHVTHRTSTSSVLYVTVDAWPEEKTFMNDVVYRRAVVLELAYNDIKLFC